MTTERRVVFDLIIRLSYDCDSDIAEVPSQSWIAHILGLDTSDVCRAEKALLSFGMLDEVYKTRVDQRIYVPQPDSSKWGGENFAWRISDPIRRARQIQTELLVGQRNRSLEKDDEQAASQSFPSEAESFAWSFLKNHPPTIDNIANGRHPFVTPPPAVTSGHPVTVEKPPSTLPAQTPYNSAGCSILVPSQGASPKTDPLAVQPPSERIKGRPASANLAVEPPQAASAYPAVGRVAHAPLVGQPKFAYSDSFGTGHLANAPLATPPTPPFVQPPATCNILTFQGTKYVPSTDISISTCPNLEEAEEGIAQSGLGGDELAAENLLPRIQHVVGPTQWEQWHRWWIKHTKTPSQARCAWKALAELKVAQDMVKAGTRPPIHNPGAWLNDQFRRIAELPRRNRWRESKRD